MRSIVHLDADAFFASVEQAADARLRGKPIAVGGEKRGIIASASYEARKFGIYTPMPSALARRLCPKLILLPGDFEKYELFSRLMFSYAYDFTPDVEIGSIDEGYFDLTGARKPAVNIAQTIRNAISQSLKLSVSEGVGSNKLVSQIASKLKKPSAFEIVPPGAEAGFLAPLANKWLPGIGPKTAIQLNSAGLVRIGQIARTPSDMLGLIVGNQALQLHNFAHGIDERPILPVRAPAKSYGEQETFSADTTDEEFLDATLRRMADKLMAKVRDDGKSIRTLAVKVRYNDMDEEQANESLEEPTDLETEIYSTVSSLLRKAWRRRVSLRLVSLRLSNVYDGVFPSLLGLDILARQHDAQQRLAGVVDVLRQKYGRAALLRGHDFVLQSSHEAAAARSTDARSHALQNRAQTRRFIQPNEASRQPVPKTSSYQQAVIQRQRIGNFFARVLPPVKISALELKEAAATPTERNKTGPAPELRFRNAAITQSKFKIQNSKFGFVPLNVHSYYSFLDSTLSINAIIELAQQYQLPAIALTDKNNLHGVVEFTQAAIAAGIKPIIGAELNHRGRRLCVYVQNQTGYTNLCRMLSGERGAGSAVQTSNDKLQTPKNGRTRDGFRKRDLLSPTLSSKGGEGGRSVTNSLLIPNFQFPIFNSTSQTEGLIAVSADVSVASLFPDRFYLEISSLDALEKALRPTRDSVFRTPHSEFKWVASFPIHYAMPGDRWKYDVVQSIRTLTLLRQQHPQKRLAGEFHFRSPDEMRRLFAAHPEILANTFEIAARCNFNPLGFPFESSADLWSAVSSTSGRQGHEADKAPNISNFPGSPFEGTANHSRPKVCATNWSSPKPQFPPYDPKDGSAAADFLRRKVMEGLRRRYPEEHERLKPQIEQELSIITEVGYEEYFLIMWDLLQECRRRGIDWITRGSAADSLVCYCLEISNVCPIRFDLYFRRFLNKERMALNKLPDIDVDFPHDRKDDVIDLLFERYGPEHAAVVGGFSTFQSRSAFAEIAKVLGVSEFQVRRITERLPHFSRASELADATAQTLECRDLPLEQEPYSTALQMARFLDGFPRYPKMHPCGVVLSRQPMHELTPCFTSAKGYPTTHLDMDSVEALGLIKMDILAQGGLAVMRDVQEMLQRQEKAPNIKHQIPSLHHSITPPPIDFEGLKPWKDCAVWELIASGNARAVHHIESPAMISLCKMCNVRNIDTLIAIVSVIRPGAANESKKMEFARRYQGLSPTHYHHPSLEPCLRSTYGLVVYEEHILQICEAFASLPAGRADILRRALGKERADVIAEIKIEFADCARRLGRTEKKIAEVWELVTGFRGYAFCKAHSTAYGVEAYQSAWLKLHYPAEFMAAVLTNGKGFYSPLVYILECHRLGIPLLPPSVNQPGPNFTVTSISAIRIPLLLVKGLTQHTKEAIICEHRRSLFSSLADFFNRVQPLAEEMESLIRIGAFDEFGESRTAQYWQFKALCQQVLPAASAPAPGSPARPQQLQLFAPAPARIPPVPLNEPTRLDRLRAEEELLGYPASGHPLELYPDIAWDTYCPVNRLGQHIGEEIVTCGLVIEQRLFHQVTGEPMKFITIADWSGIVETELFAKTYKSYGLSTIRYRVLEITATVEPFENNRGFTLRVLRAGKPRAKKEQPVTQSSSSLSGSVPADLKSRRLHNSFVLNTISL